MYIYQASLYCNSCGEAIREQLQKEGKSPADPDDENSYDSDNYPKYVGEESESDSIDHCESRGNCLEAIDLQEYGLKADDPLYGIEAHEIGALLTTSLTTEGWNWLNDVLHEANCPNCGQNKTPFQKALYKLWIENFQL